MSSRATSGASGSTHSTRRSGSLESSSWRQWPVFQVSVRVCVCVPLEVQSCIYMHMLYSIVLYSGKFPRLALTIFSTYNSPVEDGVDLKFVLCST